MIRAASIFTVFLLLGCGSIDQRLLIPGDPPRLKDGRLEMTSAFTRKETDPKDVRRIVAQDDVVSCEWVSPRHGRFVGAVPREEWLRLWEAFFADRAFGETATLGVTDPDPAGGAYHLVDLELDGRTHRFSAQYRTDLLIFTTSDVLRELQLSNRIAELISLYATQQP